MARSRGLAKCIIKLVDDSQRHRPLWNRTTPLRVYQKGLPSIPLTRQTLRFQSLSQCFLARIHSMGNYKHRYGTALQHSADSKQLQNSMYTKLSFT